MQKSTISKWRDYAKSLAEKNVYIKAATLPQCFVSTDREFANNSEKFPSDSHVMWADTQNQLTSVEGPRSTKEKSSIINTAFNILHFVNDMSDEEEKEKVYNSCETIAWKILGQMETDTESDSPECSDLLHLFTSAVEMERDGPYHNNLHGVLVRIRIRMRNSIPANEAADWTLAPNTGHGLFGGGYMVLF